MQNKCGIKNIWQMIIQSGLNLIHKVKFNRSPKTLTDQFNNLNKNIRMETLLYTKYIPKTYKMKRFLLYKISELYNDLDLQKRALDIKEFKINIKYTIRLLYPLRKIPESKINSNSDTD